MAGLNPPRRCPSCKLEHPVGTTCGGLRTSQAVPKHPQAVIREGAWGIVKDHKAMVAGGHERAYSWAREYLGLEDRKKVVGSRRTHDEDEQ